MKIQYFPDTDTLYVTFSNRPVAETTDLNENTLVDLDKDGRLVALTLEHAREVVDLTDISFSQIATAL